jgi:Tol biopolymer transport system component
MTCVDHSTPPVCGAELLFQRGSFLSSGQVIRVALADFMEHPLSSMTDIEGAYSPDGTKISLSRNSGLWVTDSDGGNPLAIDTQDNLIVGDSSWSPDGTRVAYTVGSIFDDSHNSIWVATLGGGTANVTPGVNAKRPRWSPDGNHILFEANSTGDYDVYIMSPSGSNQTNLTHRVGDDVDPNWSPDGSQIVFTGPSAISTMTSAGANINPISVSGDNQPVWSADGHIFFGHLVGSALQLYVTNPNGTNQHVFHSTTNSQETPAVSPDGTYIAWAESENGAHIYTANTDGTNVVRASNTSANDFPLAWKPCP